MQAKSTRKVRFTAAVVASLCLHAGLMMGVFSSFPGRAQRSGGPRGSPVALRVLDPSDRTAPEPLAVSPGTKERPPRVAGHDERNGAPEAAPAEGPRRPAARRRAPAVPEEPGPAPGPGLAGEDAGQRDDSRPPGVDTPPVPDGGGTPVRGAAVEEAGEGPDLERRRAYALEVRRAIEAGRTYPVGARRRQAEGEVVIRVRIGASGRVDEVRVEASSGHPDLDRAAQRFARSVARLPPPPGGPMWVRIPIEFSLR